MNLIIKAIMVLALFVGTASAQLPSLEDYVALNIAGDTIYAVKPKSITLGDRPQATIMLARLAEYEPGNYIGFDPQNYVVFKVQLNCPKKQYQILSGQGLVAGKPYTSKEGKIVALQGNPAMEPTFKLACKTIPEA